MDGDKYVVLVVDDEKDVRALVINYFTLEGHRVIEASTIREAMQVTDSSSEIIIALIDWRMETDTPPLFRRLKKNAEHRILPYAYTGDATHEIHSRARAAGAKRFFSKETPLDLIHGYMEEDYESVKDYAFDDMTGLLNQRGFQQRAIAALEISRDRPQMDVAKTWSMLYMDLNHFKSINDRFGHEMGDVAITKVAETLRKHIRPMDLVTRFHGDEFGILLAGAHEKEAMSKACDLKADVTKIELVSADGKSIPLSLSVGVVELSREDIGKDASESLKALTTQADLRMSADKGPRASRKR